MNFKQLSSTIILFLLIFIINGCKKDWLSAKRNLNAVVPTTLADMRTIINNVTQPSMADDYAGIIQTPSAEQVVTEANFKLGSEKERNLYTWNSIVYTVSNKSVSEWDDSYQQVFNANIVLEGLEKINRTTASAIEWDDVKGGALFFRAKAFYNLLQVFAPPYRAEMAADEWGIPLRLGSDPGVPTTRASLSESYQQLLGDLNKAVPLLRVQPALKTDASRPAAYALLARCYLSMREYGKAGLYADSALQLFPSLMDYRTITAGTDQTYPFVRMNAETILYSRLTPLSIFDAISRSSVTPELFSLYTDGDLRRSLFYRSTGGFKGAYTGSSSLFGGLASDELYLIKAECQARNGRNAEALETLDILLQKRYDAAFFSPHATSNTQDVLGFILQERRKELAFRGLHWSDLRRLNQELEHAVTLHREIQGQSYELPPNDPRYTLPIPEYIIQMTGIPQNIR